MRPKEITLFGGVNSAFSPRNIGDSYASSFLNCTVEDGDIKAALGFKNLAAAQSGFSAVYAFDLAHGYDGFNEKEEYLSVETVSGSTHPYSRHKDTLAPTEVLDGVSSVNMHASEWSISTFRQYAYFINPNDTKRIYRKALGSSTNMRALEIPAAPTVAPTYVVSYGPGGTTDYSELSWAGLDPTNSGELLCTGAATNTGSALNSDNTFSVRHTDNEVESTWEADLNDITAGVQNWQYNDNFRFSMRCETSQFAITVTKIEFRNNDGSPITLTPDIFGVFRLEGSGGLGTNHVIQFGWSDKTRANFDNVRYIKVYYTVTKASATVANNDLIVSKITVGGVYEAVPTDNDTNPDGLEIGYSYYFSTPAFESGISPALFVPNDILDGNSNLGVHLEITMTASADSNVDNFRIYARKAGTTTWYRLATQTDADTTYEIKANYTEIKRLTEYAPTPFEAETAFLGEPVAAFAYKSTFIWLYNQGFENIRMSRVGDELRQASGEDDEDDLNRGATFTMADNGGDVPWGGCQAGDAVMYAGKLGVYVQYGDYPAQMTFTKKIAGSFGVAGRNAFCAWKTENGMPGMVYVSRDGQVYFASPGNISGAESGENISLSDAIRDGESSLRTFLLDGQADLGLTDFSTCQVRINTRDDCLVIAMGKRALKLRRPDQTGVRTWEPRQWNTGGDSVTVRYLASSPKYGIRWMRSDGKADEDEFNNAARTYIRGIKRDGGNVMPTGYWRSKVFGGHNRRIDRVFLERSPSIDPAFVKVYSLRRKQIYRIEANKRFAKCAADQQGFDHQFEIRVPESDVLYSRLYWEESTLNPRKTL